MCIHIYVYVYMCVCVCMYMYVCWVELMYIYSIVGLTR